MSRLSGVGIASRGYIYNFYYNILYLSYEKQNQKHFTCVALAKKGLVVGALRLSVRPQLLGCLVRVVCNSKSFYFFLFKLCVTVVHILKMCTSYFAHFHVYFLVLRVLNLVIFRPKMRSGCLVCVICNSNRFYSFIFKVRKTPKIRNQYN